MMFYKQSRLLLSHTPPGIDLSLFLRYISMSLTLNKSGHPFQSTVKNHLIYPPKTNYLFPSIPTRSIVPSFFCLNLLIGPDVLPITGLCLIISFDFQKLNVFAKVGFIFDFFVSESKSKSYAMSCPSTFLFPNGFEALPPSKSTLLPVWSLPPNYTSFFSPLSLVKPPGGWVTSG